MMVTPIDKALAERLSDFCDDAEDIESNVGLRRWSGKVSSFLRTALGPDEANVFLSLEHDDEWQQHALRLGHLQGLIARAAVNEPPPNETSSPSIRRQFSHAAGSAQTVFVVHGRDNEAKESTARFLEKLGLKPVILHEQPNAGRTLIEKFELYSEGIGFAVILLTPDDVGAAKTESQNLVARARQNVILELGYFMGRLGRVSVCALHKGGVELPSDYQGIVYIEMDDPGAWKAKLAQELIQAKLPIDLAGLVGGSAPGAQR